MSLSLEPPKDTPQAVKKIAATLGINLSDTESLQFLSVARLLLILPLPTNFKHALDEQGRSLYIDKRWACKGHGPWLRMCWQKHGAWSSLPAPGLLSS